MKNWIEKIVFVTLIALFSFSGVAGDGNSDKFYLVYGNKVYELREFKKGILLGVDSRYRRNLDMYLDRILVLSSRHRIDPVLVVSTIWIESSFKSSAISKKGALGLMQVMPSTHSWVFGSLLKKDSSLILDSDEQNLEAGIAYLSYLKGKIGNNKEKVMIAYNMGPKYVLDRANFKFNHQYYKKIAKKYLQITSNLKRHGENYKGLGLALR